MQTKKVRVDTENAVVTKRGEYVKALNVIVAGGFCPFCEEHLFKYHHKPIIYSAQHWLVTENAWPYKGSRLHFLFITRTHIEKTEDIHPAGWLELYKLYKKLVRRNRLAGATLMLRSGDTKITGASVNHLHAHLVIGAKRTKKTKPIKALVGFKR